MKNKDNALAWINNYLKNKLNIETGNKKDNLVEYGLTSLMVMDIAGNLKHLGYNVSYRVLMQEPTIKAWESLLIEDHEKFFDNKIMQSEKDESFALSPTQMAYFIGRQDDQILGGGSSHIYLEIDGEKIEPQKLNTAWSELQRRHPMLRAQFNSDGSQLIRSEIFSDSIEVFDLSAYNKDDLLAELGEIRDKLSGRNLDINSGEVVSLKLAILPENKTRIFLEIDMVVADAYSIGVIINDLSLLYSGTKLEPLEIKPFKKYLEDQRRQKMYLNKCEWSEDQMSILTRAEPPQLPLKKKPEQIAKPLFVRRQKVINNIVWEKIKRNAAHFKVTPTAVLLNCCALVLERWCNQERFFINIPVLSRDLGEKTIKEMIGDFTKIIFVEYERKNESFLQSLKQVNSSLLNKDHAQNDFIEARKKRASERGEDINFAPVVFTSLLDIDFESEFSKSILGKIGYTITQTPGVWLDIQNRSSDEGLIISWDAVEEMFPTGVLDDMFNSYIELILELDRIENWSMKPDVLPEWQQKVNEKNLRDLLPFKYPDELLYDGFIRNVKTQPDNIAVVDSSTSEKISYRALYEKSISLANYLINSGVGPGAYVGITLPRTSRQIIAILGVLFAGAAYVPIGVGQPRERRSRIYKQIGIKYVLTDQETRDACNLEDNDVELIDLDFSLDCDKRISEPLKVSPYDSAYVIMTSGSTGTPKGVEMMHTSSVNTCIDLRL